MSMVDQAIADNGVGFTLTNNTSLIGLDENAALNGIDLQVYSVDNICIRNLKLVSPQDLFSTPVTFPSSWNVESIFNPTNVTLGRRVKESLPADALFEYNLGVHNQSTVQLQDNVFIQTDSGADDNYISTISEATLPEFYNTPSHFLSTLDKLLTI
ncbi:hypothetical protein GGU11DRAFT_832337 [Lentinula aff. detonsa]|nr:hypothetical protein GGU11DRAFT_832337 [Lentinula aff. detonsa]